MHWLKRLWHCTWKAGYHTIHHDGIELSGYLAFLNILALFPFVVLVVAVAGFAGQGQAGTAFIQFLVTSLPDRMVGALLPRVEEIISGPPQGLLTLAIVSAIWTASSAVEGYRTVLNRAFRVHTPPAYLIRRLMAIAQLLLFTFVILVGMTILIVAPLAIEHLMEIFRIPRPAEQAVNWSNWIFSIGMLSLLTVVISMYYLLPNIRHPSLRSMLPGALITVFLWLGAAAVLTLYLSRFSQVNLIYGSLGGVIAALLFFFVINVLFIYGAEFNYLLMKAQGEKIEEKEEVETDATIKLGN